MLTTALLVFWAFLVLTLLYLLLRDFKGFRERIRCLQSESTQGQRNVQVLNERLEAVENTLSETESYPSEWSCETKANLASAFNYAEDFIAFAEETCQHKDIVEVERAFTLAYELSGEVGEVMEVFQKSARKGCGAVTAEMAYKLQDELGDVLWAVAALLGELGFTFEGTMERTKGKLQKRRESK